MVDALEYPKEPHGISTKDVDDHGEQRAVLMVSHWWILWNTYRSSMKLPLELLMQIGGLCRCHLNGGYFKYLEKRDSTTIRDLDREHVSGACPKHDGNRYHFSVAQLSVIHAIAADTCAKCGAEA
jgi:hypothetical protein